MNQTIGPFPEDTSHLSMSKLFGILADKTTKVILFTRASKNFRHLTAVNRVFTIDKTGKSGCLSRNGNFIGRMNKISFEDSKRSVQNACYYQSLY